MKMQKKGKPIWLHRFLASRSPRIAPGAKFKSVCLCGSLGFLTRSFFSIRFGYLEKNIDGFFSSIGIS